MKESKQMLQTELKNLYRLYNYNKDKADDKVIRMFTLFNLASKLEYKAIDLGEFEIAYESIDLQCKIIDFIKSSLRIK